MRRILLPAAGLLPVAVGLLLAAVCLLGAASCGRRAARPAASEAPASVRGFRPVEVPAGVAPAERRAYLRDHYWDRFDFADSLQVREADTLQLVEAFARFAVLLAATPERAADPDPVRALMRRAAASRPMLDLFAMLARTVLHDPNSPLRDDELYIPVLEALLAAPYYDDYERIRPEYDLRMARRNRPGEPAADFGYELRSGARGTLRGIEAEYTLLFFGDPDCPACRELGEALVASPMLSEMIERGRLCVVALAPDADAAAWRVAAANLPASWLDACDTEGRIRSEELYDLRALPSLYLLDAAKRVLLKDTTDVERIEEVIDRRG